MLKNRQEGILNLHGLWATAALLILFVVLERIFLAQSFAFTGEHSNLYKIGVIVGCIVAQRLYRSHAQDILSMDWGRTVMITSRQIVRIVLLLFAISFALDDVAASQMFLCTYAGAAFVTLYAMNKLCPKRLCRLSFKTQAIKTAVIGSPDALSSLDNWINKTADLGIKVVGFVSEFPQASSKDYGVPHLGVTRDLPEILEREGIIQIVILQNSISKLATRQVMAAAQKNGCRIRIYNNWQEEYKHRIIVEHEGDYTFLSFEDEPLENPINRMSKRALDIAVSLPIVAFVLPILTISVWFFQRRQSPGPIFYAQPRTGMTKRPFHIIKYRTMHVNNERAKQATKGDSRIYPFGAILRKTSLDELPQFINVLLGDMSIAGPRPHLIEHDKEFAQQLRSYYTRHFVKPGITGLAQSKGFRGEITEMELLRKRIAYDIAYINNWSLSLDLKIIFMTVKAVLFPPKTAY